jgi:hypothetical protein
MTGNPVWAEGDISKDGDAKGAGTADGRMGSTRTN